MIPFKVIFILNILVISTASHRIEVKAKFLNDLLANENVPSAIVAKVSCWSKGDMVKFSKALSNVLIQYLKEDVVMHQPFDDYTNKVWFFVDMKCENSMEFVAMTDHLFYGHPYRWVFFDVTTKQIKMLERLPFLTDSNVMLAHFQEPNLFVLQQIYKIHANSSTVYYENFGVWDFNNGLIDERTTRILSKRRRDLQGHVISIAMVLTNNDSINHLTDYRDRLVDSSPKAAYPMSVHLLTAINATANLTIVDTWGYLDPKTGQVNGMVGKLIRKEVDIGGTGVYMIPSRIQHIDFITMMTDTRLEFIFRAPPLSYVSNIYYYPFVGIVWIAVTVLLFLGAIVIYFTYILPNDKQRNHSRDSVSDTMLLAAGLASQMGLHIEPRIISGRIATITSLICLLFVVTSYTANIVALLQSTTKSISTLEDILNSEMEVGVFDAPYNRHFFPIMTGETQKKIYETKIAPPGEEPKFYNLTYGIAKLREGFFAFYVELGSGYDQIKRTFLESEKCGLTEISYSYMKNPWFPIQKRSNFKEIFKVNAFKIREHGLQARETKRIYDSKPQCDSNGSSFGSVRIQDCYAVLLIFLYGLIACIVVVCCEMIWKSRKNCPKMMRKFKPSN